jgi:hypothetical protein
VTPVTSLSTLGLRAPLSIAEPSGGNEVWRRGCELLGVEAAREEGLRRLLGGGWELSERDGRFFGFGSGMWWG